MRYRTPVLERQFTNNSIPANNMIVCQKIYVNSSNITQKPPRLHSVHSTLKTKYSLEVLLRVRAQIKAPFVELELEPPEYGIPF